MIIPQRTAQVIVDARKYKEDNGKNLAGVKARNKLVYYPFRIKHTVQGNKSLTGAGVTTVLDNVDEVIKWSTYSALNNNRTDFPCSALPNPPRIAN